MIWKSMSLPCTTSTTTWENRLLSSMKYGIGITGWTTSCIKKNFCASWRFLSVRFTYKPWSMVPHCKDRKAAWLYVPTITIDLPSDLQHKKIKVSAYLVMTMWNLTFRSHFGANQTVQGLRKLSFPEAVLQRLPNSKQYGRAPDWPAQVFYGYTLLHPMFTGQEGEKLPFKNSNYFLTNFFYTKEY